MVDEESKKLVADLKKWANRNKKNQSEIARLLDADRQRVSHWFNGRSGPSYYFATRILRLISETPKKKAGRKAEAKGSRQ